MIKLSEFSMKNIAAVMILMVLLVVGGTYATGTLKVESMPDISYPVVVVSTQYLAPPKDVLDQITEPIEKAIANLEGIKNMTSTSNDNYSQIIVELEQSVKPEDAKRDLEGLIANVKLPQSSEKPKVMTFGFASQPVYYMAVKGIEGMNQTELDKLYKDVILTGLNSVKGIDHIDSIGNQEASLSIKLDAYALQQYGITPSQVTNYIRAAVASSPAGSVDINGNTEMVRVVGMYDSIYNLDQLPVTTATGETVLLKDIAKVEAISEADFFARLDSKPAIGIHLYKTKEANAVEFGEAVDKMIAGWEQTYPQIQFHTIYNDATGIKESVNGMVREGSLGAILASIMILLFLRNIRMTFIVLISIPLSILITLLVMAPLGISLNIMTLGGMAIAIGRVVDDSIVVIENIYRLLLDAQERNESVIKLATKQVASAITSSTITTVGVFGPIAFVSGVVGEVFRPFAITLAVALLSSLLVALTVIPMLAKIMVMRSKSIPVHDGTKVGAMVGTYKKILSWSLRHRMKTIMIALVLLVLSVALIVPHLAVAFMPESDADRQMIFTVKMPHETSIETADAKMKELEAFMKQEKDSRDKPLFTYIEALVGYNFGSDRVSNYSTIFTEVNETIDANKELKLQQEKLQHQLPNGSEVTGQLLTYAGAGGSGTDFSYSLKGDDLLMLQEAAKKIKAKMKEFPELNEIKDSLSESKMEIEVNVDQDKASNFGLTAMQILDAVHTWVAEEDLGDLKFDSVMYATKVEIDPKYKNTLDQLSMMPIKTPTGATVYLNEVAKVRQVDAPASISREKQQQVLKVTAGIDSKDKGGVSNKVSAELNKIELPPGVSREVAGVTDDINKSFGQMFIAMIASVFIVYLIMVLAFGNASAPFAILFSLPLAAIGGLMGLFVTGESVNITSLIGFLMLIGIVVTNAIVLVDRVQQLREEGQTIHDALMEAGMTRLRPIVMTAGATILALAPLAMGLSKGTLISKGLAVVVIGGLTTSTLLTLVVVPVAYDMIYSFKGRVGRIFKRKSKAAAKQQTVS